ncbi:MULTISPECIES: VOC family protein [unclassified Rhizobium]|uniref:VOC family protein n=1 Tax=unclassified Rhizobium TaxID=2613769 RepID=UPI003817CAAA
MSQRPAEACLVFHVLDLDRTEGFYHALFGLTFERHQAANQNFIFTRLSADFSMSFMLGEPCPGRHPFPTFTLSGKQMHAVIDELERQGGQLLDPVSPAPYGFGVVLADPDGYRIGLYQPTALPSPLQNHRA